MDNLENDLTVFFKKTNKYYTLEELKKIFKISGEKKEAIFNAAIKNLVYTGVIYRDPKKGYIIFTNRLGMAFGTIEINKKGNGFVTTKDNYKIFIPKEKLVSALSGDIVIVDNIYKEKHKNNFEGQVKSIVKRKKEFAYFKVVGTGTVACLVPYNNFNNVDIELKNCAPKDLMEGQIVKVRIENEEVNGKYPAYIEEYKGFESDMVTDTDLEILAYEKGITLGFNQKELAQANSLPKDVTKEDYVGRADLTDLPFMTIDCDETKDRDDAVYIEKCPNGNYKLFVAISHVSHYIKFGTPLYNTIINRGNSYYPLNKVEPQLPRVLSNNICSLNENVDRLVKITEMEFNPKGKIVYYSIYPGVINSKKAMKYSEVNQVLDDIDIEGYASFKDQLVTLEEWSSLMEKLKAERHYLNFDIPEIKVNENSKDNRYTVRPTGKAEKIIENAMIEADNVFAKEYSDLPIIYRVHGEPHEESLDNILHMIKSFIHVGDIKNMDVTKLNRILNILNENEKTKLFNQLILKTMDKARYSPDNYGHFGLQLRDYCHVTSPIRRAADYINQLVVDHAEPTEENLLFLRNMCTILPELSSKFSQAENISKEFERDALVMDMARYMKNYIGKEFDAQVQYVTENAIFIVTKDNIPGKINLYDLRDGHTRYQYNKNKYCMESKDGKRIKMGDFIKVKLISASKENRSIYFELARTRKLSEDYSRTRKK